MVKVADEPALIDWDLGLPVMLKLPTLTEIWSECDKLPAVPVTVMVKSRLGVSVLVDIVRNAVAALLK
jgi:hypothetical protein